MFCGKPTPCQYKCVFYDKRIAPSTQAPITTTVRVVSVLPTKRVLSFVAVRYDSMCDRFRSSSDYCDRVVTSVGRPGIASQIMNQACCAAQGLAGDTDASESLTPVGRTPIEGLEA